MRTAAIYLVGFTACCFASYGFALAGKLQSVWFWLDVLGVIN